MNQPQGTVTAIRGDRAVVRVERAFACARCQAGRGCGAGLLEAGRGAREFTLHRPPGIALAPGDRVSLRLAPERLLRAALLAYGLPLIALLGVPAAVNWLRGPLTDAELVLAAAVALAGSLAAGRRLLARDRCPGELEPDIGERLPPAAAS